MPLASYYKPPGISSYDIIRRLKKIHPGEKIGHGGTLDPFAEGVLVIGIGRENTRLLGAVLKNTRKTYRATLRLGASSTTDDPEGEIVEDPNFIAPSRARIEEIIPRFFGTIEQVPPVYSALKIQGQPAYKRVRRGEEVVMTPKQVEIFSLEIVACNPPELVIDVTCGSGVYIRALARDIGRALGTTAYLTGLVRTRIFRPEGDVDFTIEGSVKV